jgi:hypothetical protein
VVLLLVAGFWLFFAIASRWGEGFSAAGLPSLATRGGGIILLTAVAWRWPLVGGWLLLLVGVLLYGGAVPFARNPSIMVRIMLAGPPALVGALLVVAALAARARRSLGT